MSTFSVSSTQRQSCKSADVWRSMYIGIQNPFAKYRRLSRNVDNHWECRFKQAQCRIEEEQNHRERDNVKSLEIKTVLPLGGSSCCSEVDLHSRGQVRSMFRDFVLVQQWSLTSEIQSARIEWVSCLRSSTRSPPDDWTFTMRWLEISKRSLRIDSFCMRIEIASTSRRQSRQQFVCS